MKRITVLVSLALALFAVNSFAAEDWQETIKKAVSGEVNKKELNLNSPTAGGSRFWAKMVDGKIEFTVVNPVTVKKDDVNGDHLIPKAARVISALFQQYYGDTGSSIAKADVKDGKFIAISESKSVAMANKRPVIDNFWAYSTIDWRIVQIDPNDIWTCFPEDKEGKYGWKTVDGIFADINHLNWSIYLTADGKYCFPMKMLAYLFPEKVKKVSANPNAKYTQGFSPFELTPDEVQKAVEELKKYEF